MTLQLRFGFIIPLFFSMSTWAADLVIKPNHPDQYTVVKNDTLWDISGKFLQHPSQWPELWSYNTQIKNPNLIYPGDTLYFTTINGKPQLNLSRNPSRPRITSDTCILKEADFKNGRKDFAIGKDGKLKPCIRESEIEQPIRLIPYYQIAKYLSSPKIVGANELNQAPYIVDVLGEHILAGTGDKIFVRSIMESNNMSYMIYRAGATLKDGETKELLGYEAKHIGNATLAELGDPATLIVENISGAVRIGDRIMPHIEDDVNFNYFARPPEQPIRGSIISVLDGVTQIGINDVVVIDRGRLDGLLPGHELNIYQNGGYTRDPYSVVKNDKVRLPDQLAGMLMVFRTFDRVSYALVMQASGALHVLDRVQTPE
jgi:hypothetical protein